MVDTSSEKPLPLLLALVPLLLLIALLGLSVHFFGDEATALSNET